LFGATGPDAPFVNNYGVWVDEFEALGLSHTLEKQYPDAECFFGEGQPVSDSLCLLHHRAFMSSQGLQQC
jgi:hypothetical protein